MRELDWPSFPEWAMGQAKKDFAVVSPAQTLKFPQLNEEIEGGRWCVIEDKKNIWPFLNFIQHDVDRIHPTDIPWDTDTPSWAHRSDTTSWLSLLSSLWEDEAEQSSLAQLSAQHWQKCRHPVWVICQADVRAWRDPRAAPDGDLTIPTVLGTSMGSFLSSFWSDRKFKLDRKGCWNYACVWHIQGVLGFGWAHHHGQVTAHFLMGVRGTRRREQAAVCAIHCPSLFWKLSWWPHGEVLPCFHKLCFCRSSVMTGAHPDPQRQVIQRGQHPKRREEKRQG